MSITISFSGQTANEIRKEALAFFGGAPAENTTTAPAPASDDKDALVARAQELGVTEANKRWGVPRLEQAIAEAEEQSSAGSQPADDSADPFALDDPEPEKPVTKEDVRNALVAYQTAVKEKLIGDGAAEKEASAEAMKTAQSVLHEASGSDNLGSLTDDKFASVVAAAEKALAGL